MKSLSHSAYTKHGRFHSKTLLAGIGKDVERYVYDPAGNILEKTVGGRKTTYTYDAANQLVSSTDADGKVTEYAYDAVGRMVKEGTKTYRYGYLDKVLAVTEEARRIDYGYHVDGQLATATRAGGPRSSRPQSQIRTRQARPSPGTGNRGVPLGRACARARTVE